jgi:heme-degrading monooxygenase HmoA
MRPRHGEAAQVSQILNDLVSYFTSQPGCLDSYTLIPQEGGDEVGRLTLWRSEHDAEAVASTAHVMALRSELIRIVEAGSHLEKSFFAESRTAAEASSRG